VVLSLVLLLPQLQLRKLRSATNSRRNEIIRTVCILIFRARWRYQTENYKIDADLV
jgi:hypothetical protein